MKEIKELEESLKIVKLHLERLGESERLTFIEYKIAENFCIHCGNKDCSGYCLSCYDD